MLQALEHHMLILVFPAAMAMAAATDLLSAKIPNRLSATLAATFVGTRTNSPSATLWLPAYTRVDVNADYRLNDHVTLFGRIVNPFNATYQDPSGYNTSGLAVYAGLTATH